MQHHADDLISPVTALWLGFSGILGSLVLFSGDMLFYYHGAQTDLVANMSVVSSTRIIVSGLSALIAAWLYTLASGQLYFAFQPAKKMDKADRISFIFGGYDSVWRCPWCIHSNSNIGKKCNGTWRCT